MPKIRITNITSFLQPPGFGLDFHQHYIPPNPARPLVIDIPVIPQILEEWQENKWCKVQDADDKTPVTKDSVITPGLQVNEAKASKVDTLDDDLDEEGFDLTVAKEAALTGNEPVGGPVPIHPINQAERAKAKISLGTEDGMNLADTHSPIPGDRPVSVDDSDKFTVRAPRQNGPGAVVRSS
jgi:hypothetical protein